MSHDHWEHWIRHSPSLLLLLDGKLACREISEGWRNRLGGEITTFEALTLDRLFDLDAFPELPRHFAAAASDGTQLVDFPAALRVLEGVLLARLTAWRPENGERPDGLALMAVPDSEGKEGAIAQLAQLRSQHFLILDAAGEGIYGLDRNGKVTFGNDSASAIVGWRTENILGRTAHDVHHHSHGDGSPYPQEDCPIYAALKDGEVHTVDDEVFWHANGKAIPVEYTSTPILKDGKPNGAVVIFRDVSRRKELERQRAEAFDEIRLLKEQLEQERDYLRDEISVSMHFDEIIGDSRRLRRTLAQVEAVAPTPANVLVLGESGVGKEMIARAIHSQSDRAEKPLVKVNCASIPKDLFESEFFGHVRGAFTGAHRDRVGRLQLADGGTLFLDEVGEIPMSLQGKLLRALQEGEFERVGDDRTVSVDVRVVAATNRSLTEDVSAGRFREDLYYRLSVFPIEVPALRDRPEDIAPLAIHFLGIICRDLGRPALRITRAQLATLRAHNWPGNIRELRNVIERAAISSSGSRLRLDRALHDVPRRTSTPGPTQSIREDEVLTDADIRALEKANLVAALRRTGGRVWGEEGAAELLGLKPSTLTYRMKTLGIDKTAVSDETAGPDPTD